MPKPHSLAFGKITVIGSILIVFGLAILLFQTAPNPADPKRASIEPLHLFCAAGMRLPVEEIRRSFEEETGIPVYVQYGGSNTLLNQMQVSRKADLYLAADKSYVQIAKDSGLIKEMLPIAMMEPVIAVPTGNPKNIQSIEDLLEGKIGIALGNPDQAAVGKVAREALMVSGHWDRIKRQTSEHGVYKPTVPDVANTIKIGSVDAGIVWSSTASQVMGIEGIRVPELSSMASEITIGVSVDSKQSVAALNFARYLTGSNKGLKTFERLGYDSVQGDPWIERPELTFFSGSLNRRGLEEALKRFEMREGVRVNTVYNGCGILTAQMSTIKNPEEFPDVYMACDQYYLDNVADLFVDGTQISKTRIVMVVAEGNPKGITTLQDLTRDGVRVALGQPEQCTIGALSRRLLQTDGSYETIINNNVVTQTATSALLVPAITTGAADVALAYITDAQAEAERVDTVFIDSPLAEAVQPFAIAKNTRQTQLSKRLFETIIDARQDFELAGFDWLLQNPLARDH